jgi:hypothetical protein
MLSFLQREEEKAKEERDQSNLLNIYTKMSEGHCTEKVNIARLRQLSLERFVCKIGPWLTS